MLQSTRGRVVNCLRDRQRVWEFDVRVVRRQARWVVDQGIDELPGMIGPRSALTFYDFASDDRAFLSSLALTIRADSARAEEHPETTLWVNPFQRREQTFY